VQTDVRSPVSVVDVDSTNSPTQCHMVRSLISVLNAVLSEGLIKVTGSHLRCKSGNISETPC